MGVWGLPLGPVTELTKLVMTGGLTRVSEMTVGAMRSALLTGATTVVATLVNGATAWATTPAGDWLLTTSPRLFAIVLMDELGEGLTSGALLLLLVTLGEAFPLRSVLAWGGGATRWDNGNSPSPPLKSWRFSSNSTDKELGLVRRPGRVHSLFIDQKPLKNN
jgi:hypothetical protein